MILPAQTIRDLCTGTHPLIHPFHERTVRNGMTFGLSAAGYDIRIAETRLLMPGEFTLASTIERFEIPHDLMMQILDKSTLARQGLAVQNTVAEPGWCGWLTIELSNHGPKPISLLAGDPVAQAIFARLESPTTQPYAGRYQHQEAGPQPARTAREGEAA